MIEEKEKTEVEEKKHTSRVFILEVAQNVNITLALEYGIIITLFQNTADNNNNDNDNNNGDKKRISQWETRKFGDEIIKRLEEYEYNPESDYILIAGHMISMTIMIAKVISEYYESHKYIKVLFWSSHFGRYVSRKL